MTTKDELPSDENPLPDELPTHNKERGRRSRRKVFLVVLGSLVLFIVVVILFLSGPGFRMIGESALLSIAEKEGIEGELKITGNLATGFGLEEVDLYSETSPVRSLQLEQARVRYDILNMALHFGEYRWIELAGIHNIDLDLFIPDSPLSENSESGSSEQSGNPTPEEFSPLWNLLESDIRITDISANVTVGGKTYVIEDFSVELPSGPSGSIGLSKLVLPEITEREGIDVPISKGERELVIGPVSILDGIVLDTLRLSENSPGVYEVDADARILDSKLIARYSTAGFVHVSMAGEEKVTLGEILELSGQELPLQGRVDTLQMKFQGDFSRPSTWGIDGEIGVSAIQWEEFSIDSALVKIQDGTANVSIRAQDTEAQLSAHIPLHLVKESSKLAEAPISIDADLDVRSLSHLLSSFAPDLPLEGSLEGKISNFQIVEGKTVQSGSALFQMNDTQWDGNAIRGVQIAASVTQPNQIGFRTDASLSESNLVTLSGQLDSEKLTYEATGTVGIETDEVLIELLDAFDAGETFRGKLDLAWQGGGHLKDNFHHGKIDVDIPGATLLEGKPMTAKIAASYNGDQAAVPEFSLLCDDIKVVGSGSWKNQRISVPRLSITDETSEQLRLTAELPFDPTSESGPIPEGTEMEVTLQATGLEISSLTGFVMEEAPLNGALSGKLNMKGSLTQLASEGDFEFIPEEKTAGENSKLTLAIDHQGNPTVPSTWDLNLKAFMSGLKWKDTPLEKMSLHASTVEENGGKNAVAELSLNQSTANIQATASIGLDEANDFAALAKKAIAVNGSVLVERVEQLLQDFAPEAASSTALTGSLATSLDGFELIDGSLERGTFRLHSENLAVADTPLGDLDLNGTVISKDQIEATLSLPLDEESEIDGKGSYGLKTGEYTGELAIEADLASKGKLRDLLADRNFADLLPANSSLEWKGSGVIAGKQEHSGNFSIEGDGLTLAGGAPPIGFSLKGEYTETSANIPELEITSKPIHLKGSLNWKDGVLTIPRIAGTHSDKEILSLKATVPLDPEKLTAETWFQQDTPLSLTLTSTNLPVAEVMKIVQPKPPVSALLDLTLDVSGTPGNPTVDCDVNVSDILVAQDKKDLPVGALSLALSARGEQATVEGSFRHPDVQPFTLNAAIPFHPGEWASARRDFSEENFTASAKMDRSSLAFLSTQVPGIEDIDGTIALDVDLSGTVKKPKILGNGIIDVDRLRLDNRNAPSFYDIDSKIRFADETVVIDQFKAIVAGGIVELSGNAAIGGESPVLDFALRGSDVLVARTPDVNVRTDVDIRLAGPWETASLSGSLGITNSRFFKNIDLLPIGLPSRNKSVLPTVERVPSGGGPASVDLDIGVPMEPFKNWPVDLRIYTKDPFLIRGNLAQSSIEADLRITNNLGKPVPIGSVNIAEGTLTLPFSSVEVEVGKIEFDQQTGFNGALEFKARAKAGDYKVNIYAYNRVLSPKHVLTSIPPLPPEDIMTLVATGTTRDDFVGSDAGSVAASKAAMLFIKNLKKSGSGVDREPSILDKLQDRTELELGKTNPETGEQTFGGKVRLWKQLFFVGDVDAQSDYRALLKYVFKFR